MNIEDLTKYQEEFGISIDKIVREEVEMIFLNAIADDDFGTKVIFYGGTALRLAYDSPRYSEDIDLVLKEAVKFTEFENFLKKIVKENNDWKLKDLKNKRKTWFGLIHVTDEKLKHNFSLKIEIRKPEKVIDIKTELLLIKSPFSSLSPLLLVPTLDELKKLKIDAIMDREKARDVFDLWYIAKLQRKEFNFDYKIPSYTKKHFQNELQVFLPKKYYKIIDQLYEQINSKTE